LPESNQQGKAERPKTWQTTAQQPVFAAKQTQIKIAFTRVGALIQKRFSPEMFAMIGRI